MKIPLFVAVPFLAVDLLLSTATAQSAPAAQVLFQNANWSNASTVPTSRWTPPPGQDREAADDFNAIGTVTRVAIDGTTSGINTTATLNGVWVRFYDWTAGAVGNMSYQAFVPVGTQGLIFNASAPTSFDVPLPTPFQATGNHFVSLQFDWTGISAWEAWVADYQNPTMSALRFRDNLVNGVWGSYSNVFGAVSADLSIQIWGYPGTPPAFRTARPSSAITSRCTGTAPSGRSFRRRIPAPRPLPIARSTRSTRPVRKMSGPAATSRR